MTEKKVAQGTNNYPVSPSTVSSIGRIWTRFPYFTSAQACTLQRQQNTPEKCDNTYRHIAVRLYGMLYTQ